MIKSNIVSYYFYYSFFISVFIILTGVQYFAINDPKNELLAVLIVCVIEAIILICTILMLKFFVKVTASKQGLYLKSKSYMSWYEISYATKIIGMDLYLIKTKSKRIFVFVGDRLPLGIFGNMFQEDHMNQLIRVVKKKYNI
jgi:hypothetical protein